MVTNAHVVAGENDTTVVQIGGQPPALPARAIGFDPHDDMAVLHVRGLSLRRAVAWPPADSSGTAAAILGYPLDGPFDAEPGRLGQTQTSTPRTPTATDPCCAASRRLRGRVRPGNSGGPMVDAAGNVVATVFAAITGNGRAHAGASRSPTRWSGRS